MANEKIYEIQLPSASYDIYGKGLIYNDSETISFKYDADFGRWVSRSSPIHVTTSAEIQRTEIKPGEIRVHQVNDSVILEPSSITVDADSFMLTDKTDSYRIGWDGEALGMFTDDVYINIRCALRDPLINIEAHENDSGYRGLVQIGSYDVTLGVEVNEEMESRIILSETGDISLKATSGVTVNGSNVITAANFSYDSSTGTLTITAN